MSLALAVPVTVLAMVPAAQFPGWQWLSLGAGPRFLVARTFQRTVYRPGEFVQCDLWEPSEHVAVGHGQRRRGWVVTCEVCWSRVIAGTLIFSKEAPDILWGLARNLARLGVLPEKLVWDRESAIAAGGRPTDAFAREYSARYSILDREFYIPSRIISRRNP